MILHCIITDFPLLYTHIPWFLLLGYILEIYWVNILCSKILSVLYEQFSHFTLYAIGGMCILSDIQMQYLQIWILKDREWNVLCVNSFNGTFYNLGPMRNFNTSIAESLYEQCNLLIFSLHKILLNVFFFFFQSKFR